MRNISIIRTLDTLSEKMNSEELTVEEIDLLDSFTSSLADIVKEAKKLHIGESYVMSNGKVRRIDWVETSTRSIEWTAEEKAVKIERGEFKVVNKAYAKFTTTNKK